MACPPNESCKNLNISEKDRSPEEPRIQCRCTFEFGPQSHRATHFASKAMIQMKRELAPENWRQCTRCTAFWLNWTGIQPCKPGLLEDIEILERTQIRLTTWFCHTWSYYMTKGHMSWDCPLQVAEKQQSRVEFFQILKQPSKMVQEIYSS